MWTPGGLRHGTDLELPFVSCRNCGKEFLRRRAPNELCDECGANRGRRDQNARQVMSRLPRRREFLGIVTSQLIANALEAKPDARWARREQIDSKLAALDQRLLLTGPQDPA